MRWRVPEREQSVSVLWYQSFGFVRPCMPDRSKQPPSVRYITDPEGLLRQSEEFFAFAIEPQPTPTRPTQRDGH